MTALFWKELADHFGRRRFTLLLGLVALGLVWGAFVDLAQLASQGRQFFFLDVFTSTAGVPISLLSFLSFFGPVIGIALGFDAINGERTQGTLAASSRSRSTATPSTTPSSSLRCSRLRWSSPA